jgi:hypothetical protein
MNLDVNIRNEKDELTLSINIIIYIYIRKGSILK